VRDSAPRGAGTEALDVGPARSASGADAYAAQAAQSPQAAQAAEAQPILSLRDVRFVYEGADRPAVAGVAFDVAEGERLAVVGPGGSGKSTLCRLIGGLLQATPGSGAMSGRLALRGVERVDGYTALEAAGRVGFVAQDPETGLVMDVVEDELAFGPENLRTPPEQLEERIAEALRGVGLPEPMRFRRNAELSGGQQQRVSIAAVLAMRPHVLVFDDAAANLDAVGADTVRRTLERLHRAGHTLIVASPRWDGAEEADRVVVLSEGRVIDYGSPEDVLARNRRTLVEIGCLPESPATPEEAYGERARAPASAAPSPAASTASAASTSPVNFTAEAISTSSANFTPPAAGTPSSAAPTILEATGLTFAYPRGGGRPVLRRLDAVCRAGDVVAVVGPNGAGKSTFGKLAAGLLPAPAGTLRLLGKDVAAYSSLELADRVGYVFQQPMRQFVANTVLEECVYGLRARRAGTEDWLASVGEAWLGEFGLLGVKSIPPQTLSVAEQRLLALASVLLVSPSLIVLDEPTAGLDYGAADRLMRHCADYAAKGGAVLVITHDAHVIRRWTTGTLAFEGQPEQK